MRKVSFLIDGFNVYNSVKSASDKLHNQDIKWLDYFSLCEWLANQIGNDVTIDRVLFFTSIPYYYQETQPNKIKRHKNYIKALESKGIKVIPGKFKKDPRIIIINGTKHRVVLRTEKQTDVAIGVELLDTFIKHNNDIAVVVSGDTDFVPAIRKAQEIFHGKEVWAAFPYNRFNNDIKNLVEEKHILIKAGDYKNHILENPVVLKNGTKIYSPYAKSV